MAGITTHILDNGRSKPAADVRIDLSRLEDGAWTLLKTVRTNADGRTDAPLVSPEDARAGTYEIVFHVDEYFDKQPDGEERFIDRPVVRFTVFDAEQHYHVPMLCTPGSCSTYRGS